MYIPVCARKFTYSILILSCLFLTACGKSRDPESPNPTAHGVSFTNGKSTTSLSVIGDSISTGVLSETEYGKIPERNFFQQIVKFWLQDGDPANLQQRFSRPDFAAATTEADYGLRYAIAEHEGIAVNDVNYFSAALFGGKTSDIDQMLEQLKSQYEKDSNGEVADYVLLMLGANDFCANRSQEEFKQSFHAALDKVLATHPASLIFVAYLPPIHQIKQFNYAYAISLPGGYRQVLASCRDFQKNSCVPALADNATERYHEFNEVIRQAIQEKLNEGITNPIIPIEGLLDWELKADELAVDCFHPSLNGQKRIGEFFQQAFPL